MSKILIKYTKKPNFSKISNSPAVSYFSFADFQGVFKEPIRKTEKEFTSVTYFNTPFL